MTPTSTPKSLPTRSLPWSQDAEMSVVGGVLLHPPAFAQVADTVRPEDFYHPAHEAIYAAMVDLDAAGKPIDAITVAEQMRATDTFHKLRAMNGESYFAELTSAVVTIENIAFHARIVQGKAKARRLIETAQEIAAHGYGDYGDVDEYLDAAERSIFAATQSGSKAGYERAQSILKRTVKAIEARYLKKQAVTGVPSGYHKLDAMTQGFQPGELVIIAARPSMGKTGMVMNAVFNAAVEFKIPCLVFSLEMSKESLIERLISMDARIESTRLRGGFLEQRDWIHIVKTGTLISEAPIDIDDGASPTVMDIRARARRWRAEHPEGLAVIAVDYLQLIDNQREKGENESTAVGRVSKGLKALARELRVTVIALSQLNRALEERKDKRPVMSDLRDSGAIEQDADLIAFLYRDVVYHPQTNDKGVCEVIVAKQRNGPIGTVKLRFIDEYVRFENLSDA